MSDDLAKQVPLPKLLLSVPAERRLLLTIPEVGKEPWQYGLRSIPIGRMCIEAATRIAALEADLARANTRTLELRERNEELEMAVDRVATLERESAEAKSALDRAETGLNIQNDTICEIDMILMDAGITWEGSNATTGVEKLWIERDEARAELAALCTPPGDLVEVAARAWYVAYETFPGDDPIEGPITLGRIWDGRVKSDGKDEIADVADTNRCMRAVLAAVTPAIVASERERCAKVCEERAQEAENQIHDDPKSHRNQLLAAHSNEADDCAAAIRATEPGT